MATLSEMRITRSIVGQKKFTNTQKNMTFRIYFILIVFPTNNTLAFWTMTYLLPVLFKM